MFTNIAISVWYLFCLTHPMPEPTQLPWEVVVDDATTKLVRWDVPDMPKPSNEELLAVYPQAVEWYTAQFPDPSDYDLWEDKKLKALCKVLEKKLKLSPKELKDTIKEEMK